MAIPKDVQDVMDSVSHAEWKVLRNHIDAQDAEITKLRRIVSHEHIVADVALSSKSVMVAKLWELRNGIPEGMSLSMWITSKIDAILSTEPAEPRTLSDFVNLPPTDKKKVGLEVADMATDMQRGAKVDIAAIRNACLFLRTRRKSGQTCSWDDCEYIESKLSAAIGDTK